MFVNVYIGGVIFSNRIGLCYMLLGKFSVMDHRGCRLWVDGTQGSLSVKIMDHSQKLNCDIQNSDTGFVTCINGF